MELKLVFGAKSSPGLYDSVSDVIRDLAILDSDILPTMVTKHLDDVLGVGSSQPGDPVFKFFESYVALAAELGVRLPPVNVDRDKIQSPQTSVTALGML